jgi:hypothetical protein
MFRAAGPQNIGAGVAPVTQIGRVVRLRTLWNAAGCTTTGGKDPIAPGYRQHRDHLPAILALPELRSSPCVILKGKPEAITTIPFACHPPSTAPASFSVAAVRQFVYEISHCSVPLVESERPRPSAKLFGSCP